MRFFYMLVFCLATQLTCFAQDTLSDADKKEIRALARDLIQSGLNDLLNTLATTGGEVERKVMIYDSYMPSSNKIFYDGKAVIEDDINPENTVSKSGPDLLVARYLEDFKLFYTRGSTASVKVTGVSVSDVKYKGYPYVLVYYKTQFTSTHRQKPTKYMAVDRVAEVRADKPENEWMVMITRIGYYNPPAATASAPVSTSGPAVAASAPAAAKTPEPVKKPTEASKPAQPPKVETVKETKPQVAQPQAAPVKESVTTAEKKETPVTDLKKAEAEAKKEEPVAQKKAEVPQPKTDNTSAAQNRKTQTLNAEIASLEKRASKYQTKANLARIGAGVVIVASVATAGILISGYSDYKSEVDKTNAAFESWWNGASGTSTNGANFGSIDNYQAKPKSMIAYASPGIYAAGAGIIVGGVLWFVGSNNNKEAKKLKSQLQQKRQQLSVSPQWSGQQRYAGIQLRYKF